MIDAITGWSHNKNIIKQSFSALAVHTVWQLIIKLMLFYTNSWLTVEKRNLATWGSKEDLTIIFLKSCQATYEFLPNSMFKQCKHKIVQRYFTFWNLFNILTRFRKSAERFSREISKKEYSIIMIFDGLESTALKHQSLLRNTSDTYYWWTSTHS